MRWSEKHIIQSVECGLFYNLEFLLSSNLAASICFDISGNSHRPDEVYDIVEGLYEDLDGQTHTNA